MKLSAANIHNLDNVADLVRYLAPFVEDTEQIINGNIEFNDNIKGQKLTVTFDSANVEVQVSHGLGRVAQGYFLVGSSVAMSIYDGTTANTAGNLYLRSNAAGVAQVMLF